MGRGWAFASSSVGIFGSACRRPAMVTQGRCCLLREWLSWEWAPQGSGSLNTHGVTVGTRITMTSGHSAPPASQSPGNAVEPGGDWLGLAGTGCARCGAALLAPHRGPSRPEAEPAPSPRCQQPLQSSVLCACSSSGCHRPGPCPQAWLPHRAPRPGDAPVPAYSNAGEARRPVPRGHWPRRAAPGSRRGPRGDQPSPQPALGGPSQAALLQCLSSRGGAGKGSHPQPGRGSRAASLGLTVCAPFRAGTKRKAAFVPSYNTEKHLCLMHMPAPFLTESGFGAQWKLLGRTKKTH